jgi:hypothetical protein
MIDTNNNSKFELSVSRRSDLGKHAASTLAPAETKQKYKKERIIIYICGKHTASTLRPEKKNLKSQPPSIITPTLLPKKRITFEQLSTLHTKAVALQRQRHYPPTPRPTPTPATSFTRTSSSTATRAAAPASSPGTPNPSPHNCTLSGERPTTAALKPK